jgi:hypothetical protein
MAAPAPTVEVTPVPVVPAAPRVIVGFSSKSTLAPPKPTRSRSKKGKIPGTAAVAEEDAEVTPEKAVVEAQADVVEEVAEKKTTSAVTAVEKKIRAAGKKIVSTSLRSTRRCSERGS